MHECGIELSYLRTFLFKKIVKLAMKVEGSDRDLESLREYIRTLASA
ncbi:MAG: hypothetical protein NZ929_00295 [Aigarchaeota archaeon]|nr:hypothetical protein [Aigarchaeota archaeon]